MTPTRMTREPSIETQPMPKVERSIGLIAGLVVVQVVALDAEFVAGQNGGGGTRW